MKTVKLTLMTAVMVLFLIGINSCKVRHDNGKHKGWFKNSNNPHHPATTNPGHTKKPVSKKPAPKPNSKPKK